MLTCNMCGSNGTTVCVDGPGTWHCYDPVKGAPFPFRVGLCERCGHVFGAWDGDRAHLYADEEYVTSEFDLELYTTYVSFVLAGLPPRNRTHRILEIGFNQGPLLKRFYDLGFECHGIEAGKENVRVARKKMPAAHLSAGMLSAEWLGEYDHDFFDVVILTSVFEHITEPADVLRMIRPYLTPQGRIVIVVPDLCAYTPTVQINRDDQTLYGCSQHKFFYRNLFLCYAQHVNHFSAPSLTRYLSALGFETRQVATIGYQWVSAVRSEPVDNSFEYPDLVEFHRRVMQYYERTLREMRESVIERLRGRRVVCYGAGREFGYFCDIFEPLGVEILAVGDDSPPVASKHGVPVVKPKSLAAYDPEVCIATSFDYENEIAAQAATTLPASTEIVTLTALLSTYDFEMPNWINCNLQPIAALVESPVSARLAQSHRVRMAASAITVQPSPP